MIDHNHFDDQIVSKLLMKSISWRRWLSDAWDGWVTHKMVELRIKWRIDFDIPLLFILFLFQAPVCETCVAKTRQGWQGERQSMGLCSQQEASTVTWDNRGRGEVAGQVNKTETNFNFGGALMPRFCAFPLLILDLATLVRWWKGEVGKRHLLQLGGKFGPAHALAGCPDYRRERGVCRGRRAEQGLFFFQSWECFLLL